MKPMSAQQDESSQSLLFDQLGLTVFERGWLSSNCLLLQGDGPSALVDSGYAIHSTQTLALVREALGGDPLDLLLNTHLHSDHCGGNHLLQSRYPHLRTLIPPGLAVAVSDWDPVALTFEPTGQHCDPFRFDGLLLPGETIKLGPLTWEIHAAKGHDPHSVILFQADHRVLISADALWQNGFGVVFPELEGKSAFEEVGLTLDAVENLDPQLVLPGHGSPFRDVKDAIKRARQRLESFAKSPHKHARYAAKVLIKFKLLEWQQISRPNFLDWCSQTAYVRTLAGNELATVMPSQDRLKSWLGPILEELERNGALEIDGDIIRNR